MSKQEISTYIFLVLERNRQKNEIDLLANVYAMGLYCFKKILSKKINFKSPNYPLQEEHHGLRGRIHFELL